MLFIDVDCNGMFTKPQHIFLYESIAQLIFLIFRKRSTIFYIMSHSLFLVSKQL